MQGEVVLKKSAVSIPRLLIVGFVVSSMISFALLLEIYNRNKDKPSYPNAHPTLIAATIVKLRNVPNAFEAVGSLRAVQEVMLAPEVGGRVTRIALQSGAHVALGDPLVQLFDGLERAGRAAAAAKAEFTRRQLIRSRELAPTGAESGEVLDQRLAEYNQALAEVKQYDARIAQKRIVAPFAGQVGVRRVNVGQYLNPGDEVASLTALDRLYVDFTVPQQDLSRVALGDTARVASDAWPSRTFIGHVTTIEPRITEESRNVAVQALLPNPERLLRPGMYVTVTLELPSEKGSLVVPATAIQTSASGDSVTVIRGPNARKGGKADVVAVTVGHRIGDSVVVNNGLKPGDVVVSEGQIRVQPGSQVRVVRIAPDMD